MARIFCKPCNKRKAAAAFSASGIQGNYARCRACLAARYRKYAERNKTVVRKKYLQKYRKQKALLKKKRRMNYRAHIEREKEYAKRYRKTAKGRLVVNAVARRRQARKRARLVRKDLADMKALYMKAASMGPRYHVDHIIPLSRGGRHCLANLRIVTKQFNMRKGSKLDSEMAA